MLFSEIEKKFNFFEILIQTLSDLKENHLHTTSQLMIINGV